MDVAAAQYDVVQRLFTPVCCTWLDTWYTSTSSLTTQANRCMTICGVTWLPAAVVYMTTVCWWWCCDLSCCGCVDRRVMTVRQISQRTAEMLLARRSIFTVVYCVYHDVWAASNDNAVALAVNWYTACAYIIRMRSSQLWKPAETRRLPIICHPAITSQCASHFSFHLSVGLPLGGARFL